VDPISENGTSIRLEMDTVRWQYSLHVQDAIIQKQDS
jgi:hypothetical protein